MDRRTEELICRVADGVASPDEQREVALVSGRDAEVRENLMLQQKAVSSMRSVGLRELDDDVVEQFVHGVYNRLERRAGWMLVILGFGLVTGYGLYELLTGPDVNTFYRLGIAGLLVGFGLLISSVLRVRLKLLKHDKYAEVKR